jgi:hypothetical protein
MPSWKVHRLWAQRLGLNTALSQEVDKIIDLNEEFEGFRVGHDWIKGSIGNFETAVGLFYKKFGVEGVKAMMLHGVLDYMADLLKEKGKDDEEILWRTVSWIKFAGAKHVINYVSKLPKDERLTWVLRQGWGYYNYFAPNLKEAGLRSGQELADFVLKNFDEMLASVKYES